MEQKQRNKIAWILTIVLVPLLIYLLMTNIAKVRKPLSPPAPPALGAPGAGVVVPHNAEVQPPMQPVPPVDPKVLAEQKRIAALLPENNPFNPSRPISAGPSSATAAPATIAPPTMSDAAPDAGIKLTAILSRQGSTARTAMINGRLLGEGDHIAGWTIIKVTNRDVLLQDGTRQMILRLK